MPCLPPVPPRGGALEEPLCGLQAVAPQPVVSEPTISDPSSYRIFHANGDCLVHTVGGRMGYFATGLLEERRTRRHTYQVQWERVTQAGASVCALVVFSTVKGGVHGEAGVGASGR